MVKKTFIKKFFYKLQSIRGSPGSWLFKSPKKRKKEWLQQQLDLRRSRFARSDQ